MPKVKSSEHCILTSYEEPKIHTLNGRWATLFLGGDCSTAVSVCTLSSLSTVEQMVRNLSSGTPHTANIPSRMRLSLTWKWRTRLQQWSPLKMDHPSKLPHVTHFDVEVSKVQLTEDFVDNLQTLCIWNHGIILPCNIKILKHHIWMHVRISLEKNITTNKPVSDSHIDRTLYSAHESWLGCHGDRP